MPSTRRFHVLRPQNEPIPADLAQMLKPDILRRLKRAQIAVAAVLPDRLYRDETVVEIVEFGPNGVQAVQHVGGVFEMLSTWRKTRTPDARAAVRAFITELDPRILRALARTHSLKAKAYNWASLDPERHVNAMLAYPLFVREMIQSVTINTAIHRSAPLEDAIAMTVRWSRAHIRLTARLSPAVVRNFRGDMHAWLDRTPNHLLPRTHAQWKSWARLWRAIDSYHRTVPDSLRAKVFADTANRKGWEAELRSVIGETDMGAAVRSARDALHAMLTGVLIPAAAATGAVNLTRASTANNSNKTSSEAYVRLFSVIVGDGGLKPLLAFSKAWHERQGRMDRLGASERSKFPDAIELPRLLDEPWTSPEGITYTPLLTAGDVRAEGKKMSHCIASYVDSCAEGYIFAFHMSGEGVNATCTLRQTQLGRIELDDARGVKDITTPAIEEAADALLAYVRAEKLEPHGGDEARKICVLTKGVNAMARNPDIALERAEANFAAWLPLLPKRLRAANVTEALQGPFFKVATGLCRKAWITEVKRKARSEPALRQAA